MKRILLLATALLCLTFAGAAIAADVVPTDIQQPGTQPNEVGNLESPDRCDNCHGGYNQAVEPAFNWRGSMMANAGRDPIFWATLAIAEQDFDGSGDLCIRCHSTGGWYGGHSTPTDGSGLAAGDADGVDCDTCHKMTNPDGSELAGVMIPPFVANDEQTPATGYYGSGMLSLSGDNAKLGPYSDAAARHQFLQSQFHRDVDFCGSCHDVSNPAVGDLAHNNGAQVPLADGTYSGVPGDPVDGKAAFNNFPYQYGVVERTFSEFRSGLLSQTLVSDYGGLPADLQAGAIQAAYQAAGGDYEDGTPRFFSCQTCHLRAVTGQGANKNGAPLRSDLPLHDMTGGNYWMPDAILYQNAADTLRLGGGLSDVQIQAIQAGQDRARQQLDLAASLTVSGDTLRITNLTAHKLISGYPEGRRMWLNVKWYGADGLLLREDGAYGPLAVQIGGTTTQVESILDLNDPNTKIYEAHYGMTQEWASQLLALGYPSDLALGYDRLSGAVDYTLGDLATQASGTDHETFHFVLNNTVAKDNRIPPYGMSYDEARIRNALPVPAGQYGSPGPEGTYQYWDEFTLNPPEGAASATIDLLYQPTSWEYVQFLYLANDGGNAFLAEEGANLLDAWLHTGMAQPYVMASTTWGSAPPSCDLSAPVLDTAAPGHTEVTLAWTAVGGATGYKVYYDQAGKAQLVADVGANLTYVDTGLTNGMEYCYEITAYNDTCESPFSNIVCATPTNQAQTAAAVGSLETGYYDGKGNNAVFVAANAFVAGDTVVIRAYVVDALTGLPLANATVDLAISGPEAATLSAGPSGADGLVEASWQTKAPNKRGQGGTTPGTYTVTVTNVTGDGFTWDGVPVSATFTLQ
ncbi:MAG: multiheme c-type cytochrome [Anaerolineae bacterium]